MSTGGPGRHPSLTQVVQDRIVEALMGGNFRAVAAKYAGVKLRTFEYWITQGKRGVEPYDAFLRAILEAEQAAEMTMVEIIVNAAKQDPMHARWWLERKINERWGSHAGELKRLEKRLAELEKERGHAGFTTPPPEVAGTQRNGSAPH